MGTGLLNLLYFGIDDCTSHGLTSALRARAGT